MKFHNAPYTAHARSGRMEDKMTYTQYHAQLAATDLAELASNDSAEWHKGQRAMQLLRVYDDMYDIDDATGHVQKAIHAIYDELEDLRTDAVDADKRSVDFGDDYQADDAHCEYVEKHAISVDKAIRLTRDAAIAAIMGATA